MSKAKTKALNYGMIYGYYPRRDRDDVRDSDTNPIVIKQGGWWKGHKYYGRNAEQAVQAYEIAKGIREAPPKGPSEPINLRQKGLSYAEKKALLEKLIQSYR